MSYFFQGFPTIQYDIDDDGHTIETIDIFRTVKPKQALKDDLLLYSKYTIQDGERPDHVSQKLYNSSDYFWTFFMVNENLVNLFNDWPLSRKEFEDMLPVKYPGYVLKTTEDIATKFIQNETIQGLVSGATATITFKDVNTNTIKVENIVGTFRANELVRGVTSQNSVTITGQTEFYNATKHYINSTEQIVDKAALNATPVTYMEYEMIKNEEKSQIVVIRPQYIARVAEEFFKQINPDAE